MDFAVKFAIIVSFMIFAGVFVYLSISTPSTTDKNTLNILRDACTTSKSSGYVAVSVYIDGTIAFTDNSVCYNSNCVKTDCDFNSYALTDKGEFTCAFSTSQKTSVICYR